MHDAAVLLQEVKRHGLVELPDEMTLARLLATAYEGAQATPNKHDYRAAENLIKSLTT